MLYVAIVFAFFAGFMGCIWFIRFRAKRSPMFVIRFDGAVFAAFKARLAPGGVLAITPDGDVTYPTNIAHRVVLNPLTGLCAYLVAAEPIPLAKHEALEVGRDGIAFASMFKSGGDLLRWLQIGSLVVPIAAIIWLVLQFGGVQSSLVETRADNRIIIATLNKLAPAPSEVPTNAPSK